MQRLHLLGEQIKSLLQSWMPRWVLGVVIKMPVMALGKQRHAIHVRCLKCLGEFSRIKIHANVPNER